MTNEQFELKYNLYYKYLLCLAYNYTFSIIDSEDIVQEVFFKYYKRNKEFKDEMHEKNWLIRVTINQCIDFLRKKKNNKLIISVDYINKLPNTSDGEKKDGELIAYVNMLNYKYRTVIILFYYDNYSIS
ncbi:MAG: sigma-70 family RNA polymerase sigma factor [Bacilli bacterium]|nr:sigma-70 family RNA polymerase sigma factor [Bacilli bacterium]